MKEGSPPGRYPSELLYEYAVTAAARSLRPCPSVADIWLRDGSDDRGVWYCPTGFSFVSDELSEEKRLDLEMENTQFRPREPEARGWSEHILSRNEPLRLEDGSKREPAPDTVKMGLHTCVGIPVRFNGIPIGVMWIRYMGVARIDDRDLEALMVYWERIMPLITKTGRAWVSLSDKVGRRAIESACR
jgi:hypothetical protein